MKRRLLVPIMLLILILTGCGKTLIRERTEVTAVVTDKVYVSETSGINMIYTGKTTMLLPYTHPAEWNVTISYEDISITVDDEKFYNTIDCNQKIQVYLDEFYTESGEFEKRTITMINESEEGK